MVRDARKEQLEKAFQAADAADRLAKLRKYLADLEAQLPRFREPYGERAKVWIQVVRKELGRSDPSNRTFGGCLQTPPWRPWPRD